MDAPQAEDVPYPAFGEGDLHIAQESDPKMSEQDASSNEGSQASPAEPDIDAIKMFVGQIPRSWNEPECRKMFEKYGPVYSLNILRDKQTQQSKGCCFVTYYHRKDAIGAQCALHNVETIEGMHHAVQMKPADTENRNERKLFIGQLSKKQSEEDVRQMFLRFGHIEDVSVLRDSEGRSRGCAFVTFTTRTCAVNATKEMHHSQTMEGCTAPLVVKFADAQKERDHRQGGPKGGPTPLMANPISTPGIPLLGQLAAQPGLNMQALGSLLSLLQPGQQNMLAALGNVLSALGKISGGDAQSQNIGGSGQSAQQLTQQIAALLQAQGHDSLALQQQLAMAQQQQHQQSAGDYGGYGYQASYGKKAVSPVDQYLHQYAMGAIPGSGSTPAVGNGDTKGPDGSNLFIYHLPQDFGDSDLLSTFSPFGAVLSAKVFIDKVTNLSKCFGFISYDNALSAQNAINAMNGFQIGSKRLKVQLKNEKTHPYAKA